MLDKKGWIQNTYREHLSNSTHKILPIHWKIQFYTMLNIYEHLDFWAWLRFLNTPWTLKCNFAVNTNFHIQMTDYLTIEKFSRVSTGCLSKAPVSHFSVAMSEVQYINSVGFKSMWVNQTGTLISLVSLQTWRRQNNHDLFSLPNYHEPYQKYWKESWWGVIEHKNILD